MIHCTIERIWVQVRYQQSKRPKRWRRSHFRSLKRLAPCPNIQCFLQEDHVFLAFCTLKHKLSLKIDSENFFEGWLPKKHIGDRKIKLKTPLMMIIARISFQFDCILFRCSKASPSPSSHSLTLKGKLVFSKQWMSFSKKLKLSLNSWLSKHFAIKTTIIWSKMRPTKIKK